MARVILETERLILREFALSDAPFVLRQLNEPSFHDFIGDKGIRNLEDARDYIRTAPLASYEENGYGLYVVSRREDGVDVGSCGLVKRERLDHPDIGFAFLEEYFRMGYAFESSIGVMQYAVDVLGLPLIAALVDHGNERSERLLERLGFSEEGTFHLDGDDKDVRYFAWRSGE